jgi:gamma-glutamyl-gamma-aminobutyrate hydrolase PuuD
MDKRPVIGVSSYDAEAAWGVWNTRAAIVPSRYLAAATRAGAAPIIVPVGTDVDVVANRLDGVLLIGGPDLDPAHYDEEPPPSTEIASIERDELEIALARAASARGLPVLAICRGVQILNVSRGGALVQHLPDVAGHEGHSPGSGVYGETTVEIEKGSNLAAVLAPRIVVSCYHHQAIKRLGDGLTVVGRAADGTIEAVEDRDAPFVVGVQWHPEVGADPSLFDAFVRACGNRAARG